MNVLRKDGGVAIYNLTKVNRPAHTCRPALPTFSPLPRVRLCQLYFTCCHADPGPLYQAAVLTIPYAPVDVLRFAQGKSLPEWLPERKRRKLQQQDQEIAVREPLAEPSHPHVCPRHRLPPPIFKPTCTLHTHHLMRWTSLLHPCPNLDGPVPPSQSPPEQTRAKRPPCVMPSSPPLAPVSPLLLQRGPIAGRRVSVRVSVTIALKILPGRFNDRGGSMLTIARHAERQ